jgi:hypothetical protein
MIDTQNNTGGVRLAIMGFGGVIIIAVIVFVYRYFAQKKAVVTPPQYFDPKSDNFGNQKEQPQKTNTSTNTNTEPSKPTNTTTTSKPNTPQPTTTPSTGSAWNGNEDYKEMAKFFKNNLPYSFFGSMTYGKCSGNGKEGMAICANLLKLSALPNQFLFLLGKEYETRADNRFSKDLENWIGQGCTCSKSSIVSPTKLWAMVSTLKSYNL